MSAERLFVYGTLRPGRAPRSIADVVATLRSLGAARVRGRLYDLGAFPGAALDSAADGFVHGEVIEFSEGSPPLAWFDDYEGAEFRRERIDVDLAGRRVACWVYVLVRERDPAQRIASGLWGPRDG